MGAVAYECFSLQSLSHCSNGVSRMSNMVARRASTVQIKDFAYAEAYNPPEASKFSLFVKNHAGAI